MVKAHGAIMSLGCDDLSTLKPIPSFTIFHSPHQIPIWAHHYPGITPIVCIMVPVTLCLCLPLCCHWNSPVPCIIWWSNLLSRSGNGPPPDNICAFYHWPCGQSISDFLSHPNPYLQAGVNGCNWNIRQQVEHSSGPWITPHGTFLAPVTHTDALLGENCTSWPLL